MFIEAAYSPGGEQIKNPAWEQKALKVKAYVDSMTPEEACWVNQDEIEGNLEETAKDLMYKTGSEVNSYAETYKAIQIIFDRIRKRTENAKDTHWRTVMENFMKRVSAICIGEPPAQEGESYPSGDEVPGDERQDSQHRGGYLMGS